MTRAEWLSLAERCENATGLNRELDAAIHKTLGWTELEHALIPFTGRREWRGCSPGAGLIAGPKWIAPLTDSLDMITALIERELPDHGWFLSAPIKGENDSVLAYLRGKAGYSAIKAATPALALCAAFCRAMAAKETA